MTKARSPGWLAALVLFCAGPAFAAKDAVVLTNGIRMTGEIKGLSETSVTIKVPGGEMTWPTESVHSITQDGKTTTYNPLATRKRPSRRVAAKPAPPSTRRGTRSVPASLAKPQPNKPRAKTKSRADRLARLAGAQLPAWWNRVRLEAPAALQLNDWAGKSPDAVKAYIRDVVAPDPLRHAEGIKLLHECLAKAKGNAAAEVRLTDLLGENYARLVQDYPRSLYWWQTSDAKGGATKERDFGRAIAYAVMRVEGEAAVIFLKYAPKSGYVCEPLQALADLGERAAAWKVGVKLSAFLSGREKAVTLLTMGHIARKAGDFQPAFNMFGQAEKTNLPKGPDQWIRYRASKEKELLKHSVKMNLKRIRDGFYSGSARGFVDNVAVKVSVRNHRIGEVTIASHRENRALTSLQDVPKWIVEKQSVHVDATTGATVTSYAVMIAAAQALARTTR